MPSSNRFCSLPAAVCLASSFALGCGGSDGSSNPGGRAPATAGAKAVGGGSAMAGQAAADARAGATGSAAGAPASGGSGAPTDAGSAPPANDATIAAASPFDAGTDPERNAVAPPAICDRLTTIQCAGEAACCDHAGRDYDTCKQDLMPACVGDSTVDAIAKQSIAAFDADQARNVFEQLEDLASRCDPAIAEFTESFGGLRSIFRGTVAPNGDCTPSDVLDAAASAGALASCQRVDGYACLPQPIGAWTCAPHADAGGRCFTDANCKPGMYCDNQDLALSGSVCMPRISAGGACMHSHECQSLVRKGTTCTPTTQQAIYCLKH